MLLILTALALGYLAINLFYATQLHIRIGEMKLNGVAFNIWRMENVYSTIKEWSERSRQFRTDLIKLRQEQDDAERAVVAATEHVRDEDGRFRRRTNTALAAFSEKLLGEMQTPLEVYFSLLGKIDDKIKEKAGGPDWTYMRENLKAGLNRFFTAQDDLSQARSVSAEAVLRVTNVDLARKGAEAEVARLFNLSASDVPLEVVEQIRNIVTEMEASGVFERAAAPGKPPQARSRLRSLTQLTMWPTESLVLTLVIVMGLIGSCLGLMADHFRDSQDTLDVGPGNALLRIFYGGVIAFVVYLVAKAGVPIVADTSRIGGQAPLNPYFLSFVGIISGLASEGAIRWLRGVGAGVFGSGPADNTPRYATPMLAQRIQAIERGPDRLSRYLNLTPDQIGDALSGHRAIMPADQSVMAAFAGQDVREAFSDLRAA